MHEIEIIERLRMKRAWEKEIDTAESIEKRRKIIALIENNDWGFREQVHTSLVTTVFYYLTELMTLTCYRILIVLILSK